MPAVRVPGARSIRWRLGGVGEGPFLGGLNLRDEYTNLAGNELADGTNFTLDERGAALKRNDCPAAADFPTPPGTVVAFFYSNTLAKAVIQVGVSIFSCPIGGAWTAAAATVASANPVAMCDFAGKVVMTQLSGGTYTFDGTTLSAAIGGSAPACKCIAVWQNKVFAFNQGPPNQTRLRWCAAGDPTTWNANDFVDLRDKDDKPGTALYGGSGLVAFKEDSAYRVSDSTTGAYQTIDWTAGCVGPLAVTAQEGLIYSWGLDGLYGGNGFGRFSNIGDKVHPRFFSTTVNATTKALISAVAVNGRVYFAFPRTSSTIPDALLEFNPRVGWLMESYFGAQVGPLTKYIAAAGQVKGMFASGSASIKELLTGTTRSGFSCSLLSANQEVFGGYIGRIMRLAVGVDLPGTVPPAVSVNYLDGGGSSQVFAPLAPTVLASGPQQLEYLARIRGKAFQVAISDAASPLTSLTVFDAQMDALLTALR